MAKVSFFTKEETKCPICGEIFRKESLLSGGGRLNAGELTDELRRIYIPTKKYGKINPLFYSVMVCPQCFFAFYPQDINDISKTCYDILKNEITKRKDLVVSIFPDIDFSAPRTVKEAIASYILALYSYAFFSPIAAPSFKRGISALRGAWLVSDYIEENPQKTEIFELRDILYRRAFVFYEEAYNALDKGKEQVDRIKNFGPDLDKNFGFDGFLFLYSYLFYHYGLPFIDDIELKKKRVNEFKIILSKVFGIGKSSKDKTIFLLEKARDLYDTFSEIFKDLDEGTDNTIHIGGEGISAVSSISADMNKAQSPGGKDDDVDLSDIDLSDIDF